MVSCYQLYQLQLQSEGDMTYNDLMGIIYNDLTSLVNPMAPQAGQFAILLRLKMLIIFNLCIVLKIE